MYKDLSDKELDELIQLQISIFHSIHNNNNNNTPTEEQPINNKVKFHLVEVDEDVEVDEEVTYGMTNEDIDTTDIRNQQELINYLQSKHIELQAIVKAKDKLAKADIGYILPTTARFAPFDMVGYSGNSQCVLEFKHRADVSSQQYSSVMVDEAKYNRLVEEVQRGVPVLIIYIYDVDDKIRILDFNQYYNKIDGTFSRTIRDNEYNQRKREKKFLCWNNNKTILI